MKNNLLFNDFYPNGILSLEKGFVIDLQWKKEINKWLLFVKEIDGTYYDNAKKRSKQNILKQTEVCAEISSMYFFGKCGCKISDIEPDRVDFDFTDKDNKKWRVEVKCPSYEKELLEIIIPIQKLEERKKQPKYIREKGRSFDFVSHYKIPIKKSLDKFISEDNNILVINDNLFVPLFRDPLAENNIKNILKSVDLDKKIDIVLLLNVEKNAFENEIKWNTKFINVNKTISI